MRYAASCGMMGHVPHSHARDKVEAIPSTRCPEWRSALVADRPVVKTPSTCATGPANPHDWRGHMRSRPDDPRRSHAYRKFRDAFCAPRLGARCWLCGEPIHYTQRPRHRLGPSLDHVVPLARGGSLLDPGNARLAHYGCNGARHDGPPTPYAFATDPALRLEAKRRRRTREW